MAYSSRFIQRWWLPALGSRAHNHPILSSPITSPSVHNLLLQYPYFQSLYDAPRLADSVAKHAIFSSTATYLANLSREQDYVRRASLRQSALNLKDWFIGKVSSKTDGSNNHVSVDVAHHLYELHNITHTVCSTTISLTRFNISLTRFALIRNYAHSLV